METAQTPAPKGGNTPRLVLAALMALAVAAFFGLGLDKYLTLTALKTSLEELRVLVAEQPLRSAAAYFVFYVTVIALGLPGATILTLGGGAVFGFARGLVLASFASTLGASLSCLAARYVLRDWVQARLGSRLARVNEGIEREGAFYLFTMRMIPALPFFVINPLMGLTSMPVRTFAWVSQLGMLPATAVFVYAGGRLAQVQTPAGVFTPGILAALTFMGLLPLLARRLIAWLRARRQN
ncbi:MAG: TVP38/TMEM64 family protein [Proteobacteria bacterium]|nr:TVP38/TMEM64 family protein [Pseudomonadota bacterium]